MSSQSNTCNALCISFQKLVKCNKSIGNIFCDDHIIQYKNKDNCSICFETVDETTEIPLHCGHWFHKECLKPTNIHKCPLCNKQMKDNEIVFIFGAEHYEKNNYNNGTSIYYNYEQIDPNAYLEFGHGEFVEYNEEDNRFQSYQEETRSQLLDYNNRTTVEQIISNVSEISNNEMWRIVNDIAERRFSSEFFEEKSILTFVNSDDIGSFDEFCLKTISDIVRVEYYHQTKHSENPLDVYWCTEEIFVKYFINKISHNYIYKRMMMMYFNINRIFSEVDKHDCAFRDIMFSINRTLTYKMDELKKFNPCPSYIRRQMELINQN